MSEHIPLLDLSAEVEFLWPKLVGAVEGVLRSGRFIGGPEVEAFEAEVAAYLGVSHAVSVNSGTDALVIALDVLGVGPGDEVITTAYSFFATAEAIHRVGARPVFVDIDSETFNIDPAAIEAEITERSKVIVPVHLFGRPADTGTIQSIAHRHGLHVLEDTAQAFGAGTADGKAGTTGSVGAYSFFPSKPLGGFGDGGLLVTAIDELADRARMLRTHGARVKFHNELIGYNSRLDDLQAAMLRVKLPYVDEWNASRRRAAARYNEGLAGIELVRTPNDSADGLHVYHCYTIRTAADRRDELQSQLRACGIDSAIYFPLPLHRLPAYEGSEVRLPEAERASREVLSLPIGPMLREADQDRVIELITKVLG